MIKCKKIVCFSFTMINNPRLKKHNEYIMKQTSEGVGLKLISSKTLIDVYSGVKVCHNTRMHSILACFPTLFLENEFPRLKFIQRFQIVGTHSWIRVREKQSSSRIIILFIFSPVLINFRLNKRTSLLLYHFHFTSIFVEKKKIFIVLFKHCLSIEKTEKICI